MCWSLYVLLSARCVDIHGNLLPPLEERLSRVINYLAKHPEVSELVLQFLTLAPGRTLTSITWAATWASILDSTLGRIVPTASYQSVIFMFQGSVVPGSVTDIYVNHNGTI